MVTRYRAWMGEISIHAPRTGSDEGFLLVLDGFVISIHAPRTGSDTLRRMKSTSGLISIHAPRTGSDISVPANDGGIPISIHAPRTGSDSCSYRFPPSYFNFNPRSPHGERHYIIR